MCDIRLIGVKSVFWIGCSLLSLFLTNENFVKISREFLADALLAFAYGSGRNVSEVGNDGVGVAKIYT